MRYFIQLLFTDHVGGWSLSHPSSNRTKLEFFSFGILRRTENIVYNIVYSKFSVGMLGCLPFIESSIVFSNAFGVLFENIFSLFL